jgi:hypothetical protein
LKFWLNLISGLFLKFSSVFEVLSQTSFLAFLKFSSVFEGFVGVWLGLGLVLGAGLGLLGWGCWAGAGLGLLAPLTSGLRKLNSFKTG